MASKFIFFGGKGGVGKTTVSNAFAVRCTDIGQRTLMVSTDPAHSTSDVFDQEFGDEPVSVEGYDGLDAMEIDPEAEIEDHLTELKRELGQQMSASIVNQIDIQLEMAHRTPGAYEAALFDRFLDVMRNADEYDRVVFDTAPTGGTLRLLSLPELLEGWVDRLLAKRKQSVDLYEKAAIGNQEPRRMKEGDPIIERLQARKEKFAFAGDVLHSQAEFYLVMNPDELSVRETSRAIDSLAEQDLSVEGLAINRITPTPEPHEEGRGASFLRDRCETERKRIDRIEREFEPPVVGRIESKTSEVRGGILGEVADALTVPSTGDD